MEHIQLTMIVFLLIVSGSYPVAVLQTFNSDGVRETHEGGDTAERNPHFHGPGMIQDNDNVQYISSFLIFVRFAEDH